MKKILPHLFASAIIFLFFGGAKAASVTLVTCPVETTFSCVTAIDDLDILGSTYDMTVVTGTFASNFPDPASDISYWGNVSWADAATAAIGAALEAVVPLPASTNTKFVDDSTNISYEWSLHLPVEYDSFGTGTDYFNSSCISLASNPFATNCSTWNEDWKLAFATFDPVPIPATVWLFGSALGLLGWMRRRRA